ncbi:hypothetical protein V8C86DRAFT_2432795 [Haematococcus lacustris]
MKLDSSQPGTGVNAEYAAKKAADIIALMAEARLHGALPVTPVKAETVKSPGVQTAQPAGRQVAIEANKTVAIPGSGAPALAAVSKPVTHSQCQQPRQLQQEVLCYMANKAFVLH